MSNMDLIREALEYAIANTPEDYPHLKDMSYEELKDVHDRMGLHSDALDAAISAAATIMAGELERFEAR